MPEWGTVETYGRAAHGVVFSVRARCWCGKWMKADGIEFYCRKHGLQAVIDKKEK